MSPLGVSFGRFLVLGEGTSIDAFSEWAQEDTRVVAVEVATPESTTNADVRSFVERLQTVAPSLELVAKRQHQRQDWTPAEINDHLRSEMTDRQFEVLKTALLAGYFEWPRENDGSEVANRLDITQPTFNKHLRLVEKATSRYCSTLTTEKWCAGVRESTYYGRVTTMSYMGRDSSVPSARNTRERVQFYLLDHRTVAGKIIDIALLVLNLVFVAIFVIETFPIASEFRSLLWSLEVGIAIVFLVEYLLRIYGAPDRTAEFLNGYTMVDLIAILPTLLVLVFPVTVGALQIGFLRVVRIIRVLRFYRFTDDAEFFFGTVTDNTLRALRLLLTVGALLFISAGLFLGVERAANPDVTTFGDAFYYTVISLSTTGFGDIIPVTTAGRWVTVGSILAAIIIIPRQASKIVREWSSRDKINVTCPQCGLEYHDPDASHCKACGHIIYQKIDSRD
jgi:voltage-gated potassium channel